MSVRPKTHSNNLTQKIQQDRILTFQASQVLVSCGWDCVDLRAELFFYRVEGFNVVGQLLGNFYLLKVNEGEEISRGESGQVIIRDTPGDYDRYLIT